jgi:hypothetical protein
MENLPKPPNNTRLGFYYFPDTLHYREMDLQTWLPELNTLGAKWLTMVSSPQRAIPEFFMRSLLAEGIEPILHFPISVDLAPQRGDLELLFNTYAGWGAHYVVLFDRPNKRSAWSSSAWAQTGLVERFLDIYLPLAEAALHAGLIPVFPPLEPGGDYWDTSFLRGALVGIQRRGYSHLLRNLVLGAYAWTSNRQLHWGAGGPERWPGARPYYTPLGSEDQCGFRIFDWYSALASSVLEDPCSIILIGAGARSGDQADFSVPAVNENTHAHISLAIAELMLGEEFATIQDQESKPIATEILASNFWLLSTSSGSHRENQAWFRPDGSTLPAVGALRQWFSKTRAKAESTSQKLRSPKAVESSADPISINTKSNGRPIDHYLLLPVYEWGIADWHLDVIRPYVKKYRPTIGFSLQEASQARRVTVVGGVQSFPEAQIDALRTAGCLVNQISGDGTNIASQLADI